MATMTPTSARWSDNTRRAVEVAMASPGAYQELKRLLDGGASGTSPVSTVVATDKGIANYHETELALTAMLLTAGNTTGVSFGGTKIFDFPAGRIFVLLSLLSLDAPGLGNAGNATPIDGDDNGDVAVGTTVAGDGTLTGADVNLIPSTAYAMDTAVTAALAAAAAFDGTSTAVDAYLNMIIDDTDVGDGASDILEITGFVRITWVNGGDY